MNIQYVFRLLAAIGLLAFSTIVSAASGSSVGEDWKTSYVLGEFRNSDPPRQDQIFKIQYRVINGTVNNFNATSLGMMAEVASNADGAMLEVMYPRNFPYSNSPDGMSAGADSFIFYEQRPNQGEVETSGTSTTTNCFFVFAIPFTGESRIGIYAAHIPQELEFYGDDVPESCIPETIVQASTLTPLLQVRAGVKAENIACADGFELVVDPNGKPYCATPRSAEILKERWNL
jgi:hypothetical protein